VPKVTGPNGRDLGSAKWAINGLRNMNPEGFIRSYVMVWMALNSIKEYCPINAVSCRNGMTGFGPVPRNTIMVERKGQIRDWPK
jgi:hypothetical protein